MKARTFILRVGVSLAALTATMLAITASAGAAPRVTTGQTVAITSRTVFDVRTADGNKFIDQELCGTASLGNGGSYNWCQTETLVIHPEGNWTFNAQGRVTGSFPGCGDVTSAYDMNGHGPTVTGGNLVGVFRAESIDSSTATGGFHFDSGGDLTPAISGATFAYAC